MVSRLERGRIAAMAVGSVREIAQALDAEVLLVVRWRGGELDRLLDEGHATLVGRAVEILQSLGWETRSEVSYSVYGERGSIDVLAWHAPTRTLLVVEVKIGAHLGRGDAPRARCEGAPCAADRRRTVRLAGRRYGSPSGAPGPLDRATTGRAPSCRARRCLPASGAQRCAPGSSRQRRCQGPPLRLASCSCHLRRGRVVGTVLSLESGFEGGSRLQPEHGCEPWPVAGRRGSHLTRAGCVPDARVANRGSYHAGGA